MEILLLLPKETIKEGILNLKNYLEKSSIEGVQEIGLVSSTSQKGEMGAGTILHSVKTIIDASTKTLVELVKCLQIYVENYRTEITIPIKGGKNIVLSHGRSMTAEQLQELVSAILKNIAQ